METNDSSTSSGAPPESKSSTVVVILAWLAVGLPLLWGVAQTFRKALTLFE